jgi:hypothetical protein
MRVEASRPCLTNGYASRRPHHERYENWMMDEASQNEASCVTVWEDLVWSVRFGTRCEPLDRDKYDHRWRLPNYHAL